MHEEANDVLPRLLDAIGFRRGLLLGHSDGASIAAIYAGSVQDHRVRGLDPHGAAFLHRGHGHRRDRARERGVCDHGDLRAKLARWHADVDNAFRGWNDAWLDPDFRKWDITDELAYIRVPVLIVQGEDDQYGTSGRSKRRSANAIARSRSRCCRACAMRRTARRPTRLLKAVVRIRQPAPARSPRRSDGCGVMHSCSSFRARREAGPNPYSRRSCLRSGARSTALAPGMTHRV